MKEVCGITYQDYGNSEIPIIFLHGIGGNSDSFKPQLEKLSGAHRVISLNLPGYGSSESLSSLSFKNFADKLVEFMEALHLSKVHLCGQSIGGMIALETTIRNPNCVKSLTLIATTSAFGGKDKTFQDEFIKARLKPLDMGMTLEELAVKFIPEIMGSGATDAVKQEAIKSMSDVSATTYRDIIQCLVTFNRRNDMKNLGLPCCLIAGEEDTNAPPKTMKKMAEVIPHAEYHQIPGAGHLTNLEDGKSTNKILSNFYQGLQ